jgi:hypothetical protein
LIGGILDVVASHVSTYALDGAAGCRRQASQQPDEIGFSACGILDVVASQDLQRMHLMALLDAGVQPVSNQVGPRL